MTTNNKPIITSLLDLDWYKLTMQQFSTLGWWHNLTVKLSFKNRTKVQYLKIVPIEVLKEQVNELKNLRFSEEEIEYLRSGVVPFYGNVFNEDYLNYLKNFSLPPINIEIDSNTINPIFHIKGRWADVKLYETLLLSILAELYSKYSVKDSGKTEEFFLNEGYTRLRDKLTLLQQNPGIKVSEFGTRRRFSKDWQRIVLETMLKLNPENTLGTSNVMLAKEFNASPSGTMAHEVFMVLTSMIFNNNDKSQTSLQNAQCRVLDSWKMLYGKTPKLLTALTDTFGSESFFEYTRSSSLNYPALRHDSGNPFVFGNRAIKWYKDNGKNPLERTVVFSDGLNVNLMKDLYDEFKGKINVAFGWGTNLTNDVGIKPLSMVIKVTEVENYPTVKLSDNPAKAMGPDNEVALYKKLLNYRESEYEECVY